MSLQGIYLASRALLAHQKAIEVTGQNVTNAATPGYTRQVALLRSTETAQPGDVSGAGPVGGGVDVAATLRTHAAWLDRSTDSLSGQAGDAAFSQSISARTELVTGEPGANGVQAALDKFFNAFQNVADRPDNSGVRRTAIQAGVDLARRFNTAVSDLESLRTETITGIRDNAVRATALAGQIADLNGTLVTSGDSSTVRDQRDQLLGELTKLTGATVTGRDAGELVVSVGGVALVQGVHAQSLNARPDGGLFLGDGTPIPLVGGEIGARQRWGQTTIPGYQEALGAVREQLATSVNAQHTAGVDQSGTAGVAFFVQGPGGALSVNGVLRDPARLAVGNGTSGDGQIAAGIAGLRNAPTIAPVYQGFVSDLGIDAAQATRQSDLAQASVRQLQEMQASESGVNLDEELAHMVAQQHVYAASARLLSTYDSLLETLIQRTGV